jgi:hypothetical protein
MLDAAMSGSRQRGNYAARSSPYPNVRHRGHTAGLLGIGIALGNWLSLAVLVLIPLAGILGRIRVGEAKLASALGQEDSNYAARTGRLIRHLRCPRPADAAVTAGHLQDRWPGDWHRLAVEGQADAGSLTEIVQAGFDVRWRALRIPGPLVKYRSPSCHTAPIPWRAGARGARPCQGRGRERGAELAGDDWIALVPDAVARSKTRCLRT